MRGERTGGVQEEFSHGGGARERCRPKLNYTICVVLSNSLDPAVGPANSNGKLCLKGRGTLQAIF